MIQQYGDWYRTLAVDGWAVTFGTEHSPLLAVPNVTDHHPSTASVPTPHYSMWHNDYAAL